MTKIKEELHGIGLTDEQVYEVIKRLERHFHLTKLEMDEGDLSIKGKDLKANPQNISIKCHGKQMNYVTRADILMKGGERPRIILEIL